VASHPALRSTAAPQHRSAWQSVGNALTTGVSGK
jgi:hypothetical protein